MDSGTEKVADWKKPQCQRQRGTYVFGYGAVNQAHFVVCGFFIDRLG